MAFADLPEYEDPTFPHPKDPDEKLDYSFDFAKLVGDQTLSNPTVECDTGLIISNVVKSTEGAIVSCFIAGGEAGSNHKVRFGITCQDGRNFERTVKLYIKER